MEEAKAFDRLMTLNRWTARQLAVALRIHPSKISRALSLLRLPRDIQEQVTTGQIPARSAHELSKLSSPEAQRQLAAKAASGRLTHEQAAKAVRQRKGKRSPEARSTKQTFITEHGWKVTVSANRKGTYHDIEQALLAALEEVRHRIANHLTLF